MKYFKDTEALADQFNKFFVSTGANAAHASSKLAKAHGFHCNPPTSTQASETRNQNLFLFNRPPPEEVTEVIMSMPSNKAPGHDKVPIRVIRTVCSILFNSHSPNQPLL